MTVHTIRITTPEHHPSGYIELDGQPINDAVRAADVTLSAGDLPQVTLEMSADLDMETAAEVVLPPAVHALLTSLGWTPPGHTTPDTPRA
ncbi:MAG TPA: hypothetical protein VIS06_07005 [Mycobacteriales bacterium]